MGYTSFNLSAVSFMRPDYVPADDSQTEFDKKVIQPGLVDHESFEITEEPVTSRVQQSQLITVKKKKTAKITIFDQEALDRLREWEKLNIPIHVYGAGNEFLVWEKPSHFNITRSLKSKEGLQGFDVELTTHDSKTNPLTRWGTNLLYLKNGLWQDVDNNELPDGYFVTGGVESSNFANNEYELTGPDNSRLETGNLIFPVKCNLMLSVSLISITAPNTRLEIVANDYFGNSLVTSQVVSNEIGRLTTKISTKSSSAFYKLDKITVARNQNGVAGNKIKIAYPTISTISNNKAEY
ncbi:MAG: hypothetical protein ABJI69_09265 [Balneola sp.]